MDLQPGDVFAGHRIEGVAGRGGMGVVYRAVQLALDRVVALKTIAPALAADPAFRARFVRESRAAAAIDHPNVLPVFSAGDEDGVLYIVMRYVDGADLRSLIRAHGRLPAERAVATVAQVAAALDAAHAAGLVHRDVKPANVLLAGDHVYLGDFGLSRLQASAERFTESGAWIGTVDYMSPEHLRGEACDARSDVYALGCVLFAALTGRAPFRRETVPATMSAHLHELPPWPSEVAPVPRAFDAVIERALAKRPEDRYPSAGDLGRAALAAASGSHVTEEERTVATGAAAPAEQLTTAMPTELAPRTAPGPDAAPSSSSWQPPEHAPALKRHRALLPRRGMLGLLFVAALSAGVAAVMVVRGGAGGDPAALSAGEVRSAVEGFEEAVADEDAAALSRVLARDVKRVFPSDSQRGRDDVVETYQVQFRQNEITGYSLSDLDVSGGRSGRASGRYELSRAGQDATGGSIVLGVKRERGRPRVALIAAEPG